MAVLRNYLPIIAFLFSVIFMRLPMEARAQEAVPIRLYEQKIQAGLIYNLLKFTTWPDSAITDDKLHVCLYGGDPFDGYLNPLKGRTAQQYVIEITEIYQMDDLFHCQLAFITPSRANELARLLPALRGKNILTVSTIDHFIQKEGMIEFAVQKDQRIHLYINGSATRESGLTISDRILNLAEKSVR